MNDAAHVDEDGSKHPVEAAADEEGELLDGLLDAKEDRDVRQERGNVESKSTKRKPSSKWMS